MSETYIPGFATNITIDTEDLTITGRVLDFNRAKASLPKPVFGQQFRNELPGQASGTLAVQGHVSVANVAILEALFVSEISVPFVMQMGEAGEANDGGSYAGFLVINALDFNSDAEDEWTYSLGAAIDGAADFTPPTP